MHPEPEPIFEMPLLRYMVNVQGVDEMEARHFVKRIQACYDRGSLYAYGYFEK